MQTITDAYKSARQKFVKWAINWARSDTANTEDPPDVTELVKMLAAIGYKIRYSDISDPGDVKLITGDGSEVCGGCRVIVTCTKSGHRVVLEASGMECNCPAVEDAGSQNNDFISPFSEATAFVVREVLKHLADLDIQSDLSNDDSFSLLTSSMIGSKRSLFGSGDELSSSLRSSCRDNGTISSEDMSKSCCSNGVTGAHCASYDSLPAAPSANSSVDRKLKIAMDSIRDALNFYHAEKKKTNTGATPRNDDPVFKVPTSRSGTAKKTNALEKSGKLEKKTSLATNKDLTVSKDKISRPLTPYPFTKQVSKIQAPKATTSKAATPNVPRVKSRVGSVVKSTKK